MSLSSGLLCGGRTCADPVARSVVGHFQAQFVKNVSGSKCQRIAGPVPTASPRLSTHNSQSTTHNSRPTINRSPIHFFTPSLFSLLHPVTSWRALRSTVHGPLSRPALHDPRLTTHDPLLHPFTFSSASPSIAPVSQLPISSPQHKELRAEG
jgi:hypothetical protein